MKLFDIFENYHVGISSFSNTNIQLFERRVQKTKIMYHGTSTTHLKSIMKYGLLANPPKRTYDADQNIGNEGYATYGGIYLTPDPREAEEAAKDAITASGGDPMVIMVQYVLGSGNIDEDTITFIINNFIYGALRKRGDVDDDFDFRDFVEDYQSEIIHQVVPLAITRLEKMGVVSNIAKSAISDVVELVLDNVSEDDISYNNIISVMKDIPEYKHNIEVIMRNIKVFKTSKTQVLRNIGFKGKTRIIQISVHDNIIWPNNQ